MTVHSPAIEEHPDIAALRARYEEASETPTGQLLEGLTLLSGLYLAMSPWVVGFTGQSALTMSNLLSGITVALLALGFAALYGRTHGIAWVAPLIGIWAIISPWAVDGPTPGRDAKLSNVITGAVLVVGTLAMMAMGMRLARMRSARTHGLRP